MAEDSITAWVYKMPTVGRYFFSRDDIIEKFPSLKYEGIKSALRRLTESGRIFVPWRGFYVVVPEEYEPYGVEQSFFIDALMKYLKKEYYVCLLNAAALHGAAHQAVMRFSVMISAPSLRNTQKGNMVIDFVSRKRMPMRYVQQRKNRTGYFNVSSPELTALDLVSNYQKVGGFNRVAVVMSELIEVMNMAKVDSELLSYFPIADIQRLGYLLDEILEERKMADILFSLSHNHFRKTVLKKSKPADDAEYNDKWKLLINEDIIVEA